MNLANNRFYLYVILSFLSHFFVILASSIFSCNHKFYSIIETTSFSKIKVDIININDIVSDKYSNKQTSTLNYENQSYPKNNKSAIIKDKISYKIKNTDYEEAENINSDKSYDINIFNNGEKEYLYDKGSDKLLLQNLYIREVKPTKRKNNRRTSIASLKEPDSNNPNVEESNDKGKLIDKPAGINKYNKPEYPDIARQYGWEGNVTLKIEVNTDGKVEKVTVLESSGYKILDNAAVKSAYSWIFSPAYKNGKPSSDFVIKNVKFILSEPQ